MASEGDMLARLIILKHGVDRFPTVELTALHLASEVGELAGAIEKHRLRCIHTVDTDGWHNCPLVRKELGDAGLTLHALSEKLGIDLIEAMREVVDGETRRFA